MATAQEKGVTKDYIEGEWFVNGPVVQLQLNGRGAQVVSDRGTLSAEQFAEGDRVTSLFSVPKEDNCSIELLFGRNTLVIVNIFLDSYFL